MWSEKGYFKCWGGLLEYTDRPWDFRSTQSKLKITETLEHSKAGEAVTTSDKVWKTVQCILEPTCYSSYTNEQRNTAQSIIIVNLKAFHGKYLILFSIFNSYISIFTYIQLQKTVTRLIDNLLKKFICNLGGVVLHCEPKHTLY